MNQIKVLVEGFIKESGYSGYELTSTSVLVKTAKSKILCDPGLNRELLLKALDKEKLKPTDIDSIFLTHIHLDHSYLAALFPKAEVMTLKSVYKKGIVEIQPEEIWETDLKILATPGHCLDHCSLLVPVNGKTYAVAGDVFYWIADEDQLTDKSSLMAKKDTHAGVDPYSLEESRKALLKLADFIIPGHGKMFTV